MDSGASKYAFLLMLAFSVVLCPAKSGDWWEEKPIEQWSGEQVDAFLSASPWVSRSQGYFRQAPWTSARDGEGRRAPVITVYYQARILSAKPVREAFLQLHALNPAVVSAKSLQPATAAGEARNRLQELLKAYPDDMLVKGDAERLILAVSQVTRSLGILGDKIEQESFSCDELADIDASSLVPVTRLATNAGKRVELSSYQPPGSRGAGALYYFPRILPDGTPLIAQSDRELVFETVINKKKLKIKFDLGKLKYKGKIET